MIVQAGDGTEIRVVGGEAFEAGPGHDAWVDGDTPCVALDFTQVTPLRTGPPELTPLTPLWSEPRLVADDHHKEER
jgi:hypothetical protein